jgi:hypothetical protein
MIAERFTEEMNMRFILTGFTQESGVRVFAFERIAEDQTRMKYSVRADLALSRKYDIRTQELPLLCRDLLERRGTEDGTHALTFTEQDMSLRAKESAAIAAARLRSRKHRQA